MKDRTYIFPGVIEKRHWFPIGGSTVYSEAPSRIGRKGSMVCFTFSRATHFAIRLRRMAMWFCSSLAERLRARRMTMTSSLRRAREERLRVRSIRWGGRGDMKA